MTGFVPYCGVAPLPGLLHWNLDPVLIGLLLVLAFANLTLARSHRAGRADLYGNLLGWLLLSLAFITPLCNLSVALFSARAAQHMTITLLAAPLIARGLVWSSSRGQWSRITWPATFAFAAIFWVWHSPAFYDETLRDNFVYWLMHLTIVTSALVLWAVVFSSSAMLAFLILFVTGVQMSLLGALLTFAAFPLFSVHEFTTAAWGLTWLQDQQLGGLLMWAPAGLLLTAYSAVALGAALRLDATAPEEKAA